MNKNVYIKIASVVAIILVLALVVIQHNIVSTPEKKVDSSGETTQLKPIYSIGSGTSGSVFVTYCMAVANLFDKHVDGMNVAVEPGSSSGNQIALDKDEIDFGIVSTLQVYAGTMGTDWADGKEYKNLYAWFPAYSYEGIFISLKRSGIKNLDDLDGKVVAVGAAGSGSDTTGRQIIDFFNIKPQKLVNGSWTDLGSQLQDGLIDAIFYLAGHPASFVSELLVSVDLNVFSLTKDEMGRFLQEFPYYNVGTLSKNMYSCMAGDLEVLQGWNYIAISSSLDDDFVYYLTKIFWENVSDIHTVSASFSQTAFENIEKMNLKVHPGAVRYYNEHNISLPSIVFN